jgi:hypothetical protein
MVVAILVMEGIPCAISTFSAGVVFKLGGAVLSVYRGERNPVSASVSWMDREASESDCRAIRMVELQCRNK